MRKDAKKIISFKNSLAFSSRVFYCIKCEDMDNHYLKSQLIQVYDLDCNGTLRVGFPGNPYLNNAYYDKSSECSFGDNLKQQRLLAEGKKPVLSDYFHAFNTMEDIYNTSYKGEVTKIVMDRKSQVISNYGVIEQKDRVLEQKIGSR